MNTTPRAAVYTRVSTGGQTQSLQTQLDVCRRAAQHRGLEIVMEVSEIVSGVAKQLPNRENLLKSARRGEFDTVIVTRLDRFGRSLIDLLATWKELRSLGVNFISIEDGIDFSTPMGQFQANLLGVIAEFERSLINERTNEGRQAAKERGVRFGRKPKLTEEAENEIKALLSEGHTQIELAKLYKVSRGAIYRINSKRLDESTRNSSENA